jgi:hypothetical protein
MYFQRPTTVPVLRADVWLDAIVTLGQLLLVQFWALDVTVIADETDSAMTPAITMAATFFLIFTRKTSLNFWALALIK